jgi:trehalose 6-phosphate synthase/phosphatase
MHTTPIDTAGLGPATAPATLQVEPRAAVRALVVVSNRLPFVAERGPDGIRFTRSSGGLVAALDPVLNSRGGVWIGWPGLEQEPGEPADALVPPAGPQIRYRPVPLTAREVVTYYGGFSNRTLWPLCHYSIGRTRIDARTWTAYEQVNERFARAVAAESTDADQVWIHDYHLVRVPRYLRRVAPRRRSAFFLHVPFPAYDVFRILPWCRQLLRGMLSADLVGLHVGGYVQHLLTCAERLLGCDVDRATETVHFEGRDVTVQAHPIGIDPDYVERQARSAGPRTRGPDDPAQVIGVDRLDYTKGIPQRFLAIERFLEGHPEFQGRFVFTQVLVPSREQVKEYRDLKRELDEIVGRVNGRFSDPGWSPIRYLVRSLSPQELGAFYRHADVALVTPLRDGMNLVAKEYVAAQVDDPGVLVLSELAGAAEQLQEALLVNPYDVDAVAEALHRSLTMAPDEREARMTALRDRVREHSVEAWVTRFLHSAEEAANRPRAVAPLDRLRRRLQPWLASRPTVALFFDYDGTLTPIRDRPEDARLADATRQALETAARTPNLDTVIVSGRALADVKRLVGVAGLTYIGNHGFEIEGPGIVFRHPEIARYASAVDRAAAELERWGVPGAQVEAKGATLSYHVRLVPEAQRERVIRRARGVIQRRGLHPLLGHFVVEGRPPVPWHKGHAVLYVLVQRHGADWPEHVRALYVGDDATDEDAYRSLRGMGRSICVGAAWDGATEADFALPDPDTVTQLLRWLAAGAFAGKTP